MSMGRLIRGLRVNVQDRVPPTHTGVSGGGPGGSPAPRVQRPYDGHAPAPFISSAHRPGRLRGWVDDIAYAAGFAAVALGVFWVLDAGVSWVVGR